MFERVSVRTQLLYADGQIVGARYSVLVGSV